MKKIISILVLSLTIQISYCQDLIITTSGDSIACLITKKDAAYIYFNTQKDANIISTLLPNESVSIYCKDCYRDGIMANATEVNPQIKSHKSGGWRFSGGLGYSYQIAKFADNLNSDWKEHLQGLRGGININLETNYYFNKKYGMGLQYRSFCSSSNSEDIVIPISIDDEMLNYHTALEDNLSIRFYALSFNMIERINNSKTYFLFGAALGYVTYKDKQSISPLNSFSSINQDISSSTLGMTLDLGFDIGITEIIAINLQSSLFAATLNSYKIKSSYSVQEYDLGDDNKESLARLDFSLGISFKI